MVRHFFSRLYFEGLECFGIIPGKCWTRVWVGIWIEQSQRARLDGNTGACGMPDYRNPEQ